MPTTLQIIFWAAMHHPDFHLIRIYPPIRLYTIRQCRRRDGVWRNGFTVYMSFSVPFTFIPCHIQDSWVESLPLSPGEKLKLSYGLIPF